VNVTPEVRQRGTVLLDKPDSVEAIKASPLKTRVSLKGKIVKVRDYSIYLYNKFAQQTPAFHISGIHQYHLKNLTTKLNCFSHKTHQNLNCLLFI
jgi:hypothetical protein